MPIANSFYNEQMIPLLNYIKKQDRNPLFKKAFTKYLIVSCVGLIEKVVSREVRRSIDEQGIDLEYFRKRRFRLNYETRRSDNGRAHCISM